MIYDAYGNQPVPQSATDPQLQTRVGFRGMMNDPLAGFDSTAGADGSFPSPSAIGLYYSVAQGFYDSVSETHVTGAPGYESGAVNPYEYSSDDPTVNGFVMVSQPMNSASAVGKMGDSTPVYADEKFAAREFGATAPGGYLLRAEGDDFASSSNARAPLSRVEKFVKVPTPPLAPEAHPPLVDPATIPNSPSGGGIPGGPSPYLGLPIIKPLPSNQWLFNWMPGAQYITVAPYSSQGLTLTHAGQNAATGQNGSTTIFLSVSWASANLATYSYYGQSTEGDFSVTSNGNTITVTFQDGTTRTIVVSATSP